MLLPVKQFFKADKYDGRGYRSMPVAVIQVQPLECEVPWEWN
jgi:hypothetical protein